MDFLQGTRVPHKRSSLEVVSENQKGSNAVYAFLAYETHSAVKRSNALLCKRMRSATDKSKIKYGCMQKYKREKKAALFIQ